MSAIPAPILEVAEVTPVATSPVPLPRPLYGYRVPAGFPSPCDDHVEKEVDVSELLIRNKAATYFFRVHGRSLEGHWIRHNDIAVVDCSIEPKAKHVVIAVLDGETLIKQLQFGPSKEVMLHPSNPRFPVITVQPEQEFLIWGVVTWSLHRQPH